MFGYLKQKLGMVQVSVSATHISVEGISTFSLFKDIYNVWGSSVIQKHMFSSVRQYELKMRHFFGLDFLYICERLLEAPQTRTPRRALKKLIEELKGKTWLGNVDRDVVSITDMSVLDNQVPFPLKPYQREYIEHYGKMVPAYRLKGYLLDAGPGTGKTISGLVLGAALHAEKVIILTPKNAAERVWEDTIKEIMLTKKPYWLSTDTTRGPSMDDFYYICHYESLDRLMDFVLANARNLKKIFVNLDESHNFNRQEALRTQTFIQLCKMPQVSWCNWASGTPIMALGSECIPFLKCVDPLFDAESEERFRKIYGRDAKRANDILRNRIGHLKFHVPKQDVVDVKVTTVEVKVKIPNGMDFTLAAIGDKMRKFIEERRKYYQDNFHTYRRYYDQGIAVFKKTLKTPDEFSKFEQYLKTFELIEHQYDPTTMKAEAAFCNSYELRTIIPVLSGDLKWQFKSARSVVKYLDLKVMGEALGGILGKERARCHTEMIPYIDLPKLVDNGKKKTLIFSSFVETIKKVEEVMSGEGYTCAMVYGSTNKDLAQIVADFYKNPDINPLCATFQSLSTAVPLTAANQIVMVNQPFRSGIREQTIARAARLGQDEEVFVYDVLLDTGEMPNISTRSNDIMKWSAEQVASILGVKNVDIDSLALESEEISFLSMEPEPATESQSLSEDNLPPYLYHGSMYRQDEIMPGFKRSGEFVKWDEVEDNTWLYASDNRDDAIMLGISSAIEKNYLLDRYHYDDKKKEIVIEVSEPLRPEDIYKLTVYLYTIRPESSDHWMANYNPVNGMTGEYKTQGTICANILRTEQIDVRSMLRGVNIVIHQH